MRLAAALTERCGRARRLWATPLEGEDHGIMHRTQNVSERGRGLGAVALAAGLAGCAPSADGQAGQVASRQAAQGAGPETQSSANITPVDESFVIQPVVESSVAADETREADYLVIGSGNCGLLSAARASELGLDVVLMEKEASTGGSSFGTEAHFALDTCAYVKEQGMVTWTPSEAADYFNLYNQFHSSQTLVMSFLNHCNEPYDWWIGKGAKVNQLLTSLAGPNTGAGMFFEGKAAALADIDRAVIEENGVVVLTDTRATNLVVDDEGKVVGALAEGENGTVFVKAKATFVGTGGFGNNPDMVNAYLGSAATRPLWGCHALSQRRWHQHDARSWRDHRGARQRAARRHPGGRHRLRR